MINESDIKPPFVKEELSGAPKEARDRLMRLYAVSQVHLMMFMLEADIIENEQEYVEKYAEAFHMLAMGTIECPRELDWKGAWERVQQITKGIAQKLHITI